MKEDIDDSYQLNHLQLKNHKYECWRFKYILQADCKLRKFTDEVIDKGNEALDI